MTERPMWDAGAGEHPDEGTIHAWLDDALDAASAERVAAHVQGCAACSAIVAEARGLIAGASRVVASLDDVPGGTRPVWAQEEAAGAQRDGAAGSVETTPAAEDRSLWRRLRVTPARAALAATILVALGITLTHDRVAVESEHGVATQSAPAAQRPADAVLDSAVARNLAIAQGSRHIEAAPGPAIPQAPPPSAAAPAIDAPAAMAEQRVAAGRSAVMAQRESVAGLADRARVGQATGAAARDAAPSVAAAIARPRQADVTGGMATSVAKVSHGYSDAGAKSCYNVQSLQSGATWGDQPLPLVLEVDSGPAIGVRSATIRSLAAAPSMRATWTRTAADSVMVRLQRAGPTATIALGPGSDGRAGIATSGAMDVLEPSVASRADVRAAAPERGAGAAGVANEARRKSAAPAVAPAAPAESPAPSRSALRVTLRPIPCPTR